MQPVSPVIATDRGLVLVQPRKYIALHAFECMCARY